MLLFTFPGCDAQVRIGGPGVSTSPRAGDELIGMWARTIVFTDDGGALHSSQTVWEFRTDRTATRRVVTFNHSAGVGDEIITHADWHVEGRDLILTFLSPFSGSLRVRYNVFGDQLTLGDDVYNRLSP